MRLKTNKYVLKAQCILHPVAVRSQNLVPSVALEKHDGGLQTSTIVSKKNILGRASLIFFNVIIVTNPVNTYMFTF